MGKSNEGWMFPPPVCIYVVYNIASHLEVFTTWKYLSLANTWFISIQHFKDTWSCRRRGKTTLNLIREVVQWDELNLFPDSHFYPRWLFPLQRKSLGELAEGYLIDGHMTQVCALEVFFSADEGHNFHQILTSITGPKRCQWPSIFSVSGGKTDERDIFENKNDLQGKFQAPLSYVSFRWD